MNIGEGMMLVINQNHFVMPTSATRVPPHGAKKQFETPGFKSASEMRKSAMEPIHKKIEEHAGQVKDWKLLDTVSGGFLEASDSIEKTYNLSQKALKEMVTVEAQKKIFDLKLDDGPYRTAYTRNGRYLALAGKNGHVACIDWRVGELRCEFHLRERTRDIVWLHNEMYFAVAQKNEVLIYDHAGLELHRLMCTDSPFRLAYLPYHFLLVILTKRGTLTYTDTSCGDVVAKHSTGRARKAYDHYNNTSSSSTIESPESRSEREMNGLLPSDVKIITQDEQPLVNPDLNNNLTNAVGNSGSLATSMCVNMSNGVVCVGHSNGTVTMWTPNMDSAVVTMLCHATAVTAMAVARDGTYLVTGSLRSEWRTWKLADFSLLQTYQAPSKIIDLQISQTGLVSVAFGDRVDVFKDAFIARATSPYMRHLVGASIAVEMASFVPYDDVLGIGHVKGFSSILIPGAGEPNFDAYEVNPFSTKKQRQESEIRSLLEKIPPALITLNTAAIAQLVVSDDDSDDDDQFSTDPAVILKRKRRGKGGTLNVQRRKAIVKDTRRRVKLTESTSKTEKTAKKNLKLLKSTKQTPQPKEPEVYNALNRFAKKK